MVEDIETDLDVSIGLHVRLLTTHVSAILIIFYTVPLMEASCWFVLAKFLYDSSVI